MNHIRRISNQKAFQYIIGLAMGVLIFFNGWIKGVVIEKGGEYGVEWGVSIVVFLFGLLTLSLLSMQKKSPATVVKSPKPIYTVVSVVFLLCVAATLVLTNLNEVSFQNDEWYQVEAAEGLIQTGDYVKWDFLNNQPQITQTGDVIPYTRVSLYTWQVAQSVRLFGWSEAAARYPAVAWYLLFVTLIFFFARWWKKDVLFAFLATLTIISFDHIILHGRMVRMYSMFLTLGFGTVWASLALYQHTLTKKFFSLRTVILGISASILFMGAVYVHPVFLVFPSLVGVFVIVDACVQWIQQRTIHRSTLIWMLVGSGALFVGVFYTVYVNRTIFLDFITVRTIPNSIYILHAFADFPLIPFALALYLWAVVRSMRSQDVTARFLSVTSLTSIVLFIFFINRYDALRYNIMTMPLIGLLVVQQWSSTLREWTRTMNMRPVIATTVIAVLVLLTVVPISIPGVEEQLYIQNARANKVNAQGYGVNIKGAYAYVQEHREPNEAVLVLLFRSYYWEDNDALIVNLPVENQLTKEAMKQLMDTHQKGWIIWSDKKKHHLRPEVIAYVKKHAKKIDAAEMGDTNVSVFYFNNRR